MKFLITIINNPDLGKDGIKPDSIRKSRAIKQARRLAALGNPNVMLWADRNNGQGNPDWYRISIRQTTPKFIGNGHNCHEVGSWCGSIKSAL